MNEEQLAILEAQSDVLKDLSVRALKNGYIVTTSKRYVDKKNGQLLAQFPAEEVAVSVADINAIVSAFYA